MKVDGLSCAICFMNLPTRLNKFRVMRLGWPRAMNVYGEGGHHLQSVRWGTTCYKPVWGRGPYGNFMWERGPCSDKFYNEGVLVSPPCPACFQVVSSNSGISREILPCWVSCSVSPKHGFFHRVSCRLDRISHTDQTLICS